MKNNMILRHILIACSIILCLANCNNNKSYITNTSAPLLGQPMLHNASGIYNDTAHFLAALPIENIELQPLTANAFYEEYKNKIDTSWENAFGANRQAIAKWRNENLDDKYCKAVFYPFSGPDILHALTFYPDANEIVMFGLEPTGGVPDISKINKLEVKNHLDQFMMAIDFALGKSFFVTLDMQKEITHSSLNGVTAIMMFFLARGGYNIVQVNEINIAPDGTAAPWSLTPIHSSVNGVEILFTIKGSNKIKRARYFTIDISDTSPQIQTFENYMANYPPFTTIVKSASYLVWWDNFSRIRNLILDRSESILQDDTGVPYKLLKDNQFWKLTHFGKYHAPIPVFKACNQPVLAADNYQLSKAPIPFIYGYGYGYSDITYHLVWAQRLYPGKAANK